MSAGPALTVVIPSYDRAALLPRAVASVLAQTFADFELIVVDDGSTDDTPAVLARLEDPRIRCLRQENRGVSAARNLGLSRARGAAVTFLDTDDEAAPDWLSTLARLLEDPAVGIATAGALAIRHGEDGTELDRELLLPRPLGPLYGNQKLRFTAGTLAARRELLEEIGGYAQPMRFAENAEMAMRLVPACLERGLEVRAVERPLVTYHRSASAWTTSPEAFESMRSGSEYILEHHGARLRQEAPWMYANYRSVAAVNAARLRDLKAARRHLLAAIRAQPRRWRSYLRLGLSFVPPLATRYWTRHGTDGADMGDAP